MTLTPDEIVNYPLRHAVRGYSVAQVDELLDRVADVLERAQIEADDLRQRLTNAEEQLASVSETEATLKRTLVTAQRAAEQSVEEAEARAAELVEDAQREAATIVDRARTDAEELRREAGEAARAEEAEMRTRRQALAARIEELRTFERDLRGRLRSLLDEQRRLLDEIATSPAPPSTDLDHDADDLVEEEDTPAPSNPEVDDGAPEPSLTVRVREEEPNLETGSTSVNDLFAAAPSVRESDSSDEGSSHDGGWHRPGD